MICSIPTSLPFTWSIKFSSGSQRQDISAFGKTAGRFLPRDIGSKVGDLDLAVFLPSHLHILLAHFNNFHALASGGERVLYTCDQCGEYTTPYKSAIPRHQRSQKCINNSIRRQSSERIFTEISTNDYWERPIMYAAWATYSLWYWIWWDRA